MKNLLLLFTAILFVSPLASQNISESLVNLKKSYNPIFSKESAIISMDFVKSYEINQPDTTYRFVMEVSNKTMEKDRLTLGLILLNSNDLGVGRSNSYKINKNQDQSVLDYDMFIQFYDCLSKVYHFVSQKAAFKKEKKNLVATCGVNNVIFGGEYDPENSNENKIATFYFKIGENSVYEIKKKQFKSIIKTLKEIKMIWEAKE